MLATVVGKSRLDFTDKRDGKRVVGWQIFVTYPDDNVEGSKTDKVFVSDESGITLPDFEYGTVYEFQYDSVGFGRRAKNRLVGVKAA